jgi:hypothetical protein
LRRAAAATRKLDSPSFSLPAHALAVVEVQAQ